MKISAYMAIKRWTAFMLIITCFISCRKDQPDSSSPSIHVHAPSSGGAYFYFSQIPIGAHIVDDRQIATIEVDITDAANRVYLSANRTNPGTKEFDLETNIAHDNFYLETGTYFVRIRASDGENTTTVYREIQLFAAPTILTKNIALRSEGAQFSADTLTTGTSTPWFTLNDYAGAMINSREQVMICANNSAAQIEVWDLSASQPAPTYTFDLPQGTTVTSYDADESMREYYFALSNGEIVRYSSTGLQTFGTANGEMTRELLITENWIYSITSPLLAPTSAQINVWNKSSGSLQQSADIGYEVKGITMASDEDEILLAGNYNGESVFRKYFRESNGINDIFSFYDTTPIGTFARGNDNRFYASHESGVAIYLNNMQSFQINNTLQPERIVFEPLNDRVYLITTNGIQVMNETCATEVGFIGGNQFSDVLFLYNK
jgi:hypothetical protein